MILYVLNDEYGAVENRKNLLELQTNIKRNLIASILYKWYYASDMNNVREFMKE